MRPKPKQEDKNFYAFALSRGPAGSFPESAPGWLFTPVLARIYKFLHFFVDNPTNA
jgi:hypothetical protein